ncbi:MAG: hypothetical protein UX98_C0022G0003 [Parcubacteria group bacterium GW2011_GWA2_47_26]|nr:MAG: hypothetical protein UX98_C0022G0003 [Parcubacteria group bacterium GW2011_GWA2_47_26]
MKKLFVTFLFVGAALIVVAPSVQAAPGGGRRSWPELVGSPESLDRQIAGADRAGFVRIRNDKILQRLQKARAVVPLQRSRFVVIDPRLAPKWRWCRPIANRFLQDIGRTFYSRFRSRLQVNSAGRTILYQRELKRRNPNATDPERAPHTTGATVDIAKLSMSERQRNWMRDYLMRLEAQGVIEATEEHSQTVFHVMVFGHYQNQSTPLVRRRPRR